MNKGTPNNTSSSSQSLQAAVQAAAQINAQLAAEGKIQPQQSLNCQTNNVQRKEKKTKTGRKDLFNAEVEINNLSPRVRNLLTKGYIQEQIQWKSSINSLFFGASLAFGLFNIFYFSEAALCTKGRYIPAHEKNTLVTERPLYICIQAVDKHAVEEAIRHIHDFISEHTGTTPASPSISSTVIPNHPPPPQLTVRDKVYINLDHAPETFKIIERVLGPSGDNISYIQSETGVNIILQGQGIASVDASDEPLHLILE